MHDFLRAIMPVLITLTIVFAIVTMFGAWRVSRDVGRLFRSDRPIMNDAEEFRQHIKLQSEEYRENQRGMLHEMRRHNDLLEQQTQVQMKLLERLDALLAQRERHT